MTRAEQVAALEQEWQGNPRWADVKRGYSAADVVRLRGSLQIDNTLARLGAEKLWKLVTGGANKGYVNSLGAITGGQAMQQAKAGIEAIYLSGWQVAADGNTSETMYPDQSLYAYDSVPAMVRRINNSFRRADEIQWARGLNPGDEGYTDYFVPIVADAEAGFGGVLNAYELMKNMISNGASGVHFEDQLAAVKKCGHMGGKVLIPTQEAVQKLIAARLAADVMGAPTVLLARTDAEAANLITSDINPLDKPFLTGERTVEGFTMSKMVSSRQLHVGLPTRLMQIWCGVKPARLILVLRANGHRLYRLKIRVSYSLTIARRRLTGRKISMTSRSVNSRTSSANWDTSSSSSRSPESTTCGTTPMTWLITMPGVKA